MKRWNRPASTVPCAPPPELIALILRPNLLERRGQRPRAAAAYGAVTQAAPPLERLHPDLRNPLKHAHSFRTSYNNDFGSFIDTFLEPHYLQPGCADLSRFSESVDIMVERKRRYESQSMMFQYPGLLPIPLFERTLFPWLGAFEATRTTCPTTSSPSLITCRAGAFSTCWRMARRFQAIPNNVRLPCPYLRTRRNRTSRAARQALCSRCSSRTRASPHVGVSNVRAVVHVPLLEPEQCGFRVGNVSTGWTPGQAFVYDDTIEHEAWNDSDKLRVVLIFDIWHPHLWAAERSLITALTEGINAFWQRRRGTLAGCQADSLSAAMRTSLSAASPAQPAREYLCFCNKFHVIYRTKARTPLFSSLTSKLLSEQLIFPIPPLYFRVHYASLGNYAQFHGACASPSPWFSCARQLANRCFLIARKLYELTSPLWDDFMSGLRKVTIFFIATPVRSGKQNVHAR